jgi:hypothetical protein
MMYAPVGLWDVGSPVVLGSNGHRIQWGQILIGGLILSNGSESLRCIAPANMYSIPGTVVDGFGLCSLKALCWQTVDIEGEHKRSNKTLESTMPAPDEITKTVTSLIEQAALQSSY